MTPRTYVLASSGPHLPALLLSSCNKHFLTFSGPLPMLFSQPKAPFPILLPAPQAILAMAALPDRLPAQRSR